LATNITSRNQYMSSYLTDARTPKYVQNTDLKVQVISTTIPNTPYYKTAYSSVQMTDFFQTLLYSRVITTIKQQDLHLFKIVYSYMLKCHLAWPSVN